MSEKSIWRSRSTYKVVNRLVEFTGIHKHGTHIGEAVCLPARQATIEDYGVLERIPHIRDLPDVKVGNVLVKGRRTLKHRTHRGSLGRIPARKWGVEILEVLEEITKVGDVHTPVCHITEMFARLDWVVVVLNEGVAESSLALETPGWASMAHRRVWSKDLRFLFVRVSSLRKAILRRLVELKSFAQLAEGLVKGSRLRKGFIHILAASHIPITNWAVEGLVATEHPVMLSTLPVSQLYRC